MRGSRTRTPAAAGTIVPFQEKLSEHIRNGTRSDGSPGQIGGRWNIKKIAGDVGVTEQAFHSWTSGRSLPEDMHLVSLERVFFGSNPAHDADKKEFRASYELAKRKRDAVLTYEPLLAPDRCFGRDRDAATLIAALTASPGAAVAVLGPPGVGKTTLTRQVAVSPPVIKHFGDRRWFIELEAAIDATALQTTVIGAIGLDPTYVNFRDAQARLSRQACLLVLDNLETPWERDMAAVQDCLRQLAALPSVTVLVSLRGRVAPAGPAFTHRITLDSLALAETKRLFLDLAPRIRPDDPYLEPLLRELRGMPLAIELVAYRAAPYHSLRDVGEAWQRTGVTLATHPDQPDGRYTSVLRSIELSWQSPRLREEGKRLFRLLGQLPGGMAKPDRAQLMGEDAHEATRQLLATGLAFLRNHDRLDLLPLLRAFARELPEAAAIAHEIWANHYLGLGGDLMATLGTEKDSPEFMRLREEYKNLERSLWAAGETMGRKIASGTAHGARKAIQDQIQAIQKSLGPAQEALDAAHRNEEDARLARARRDNGAATKAEQQAEMLNQKAMSMLGEAVARAMRVFAAESSKSSGPERRE